MVAAEICPVPAQSLPTGQPTGVVGTAVVSLCQTLDFSGAFSMAQADQSRLWPPPLWCLSGHAWPHPRATGHRGVGIGSLSVTFSA